MNGKAEEGETGGFPYLPPGPFNFHVIQTPRQPPIQG